MRKRKDEQETRKKPVLDLYITHWTEPWEVGEKAFQMLGLQRCVDWDEICVTIVHDGVEPFPESYFKNLPFPVHQEFIPHGGPSAARNWGIDHGEGEWIKWCDFDDMLYGVYNLKRLMDAFHDGVNFDFLWWTMTAEAKDGKTVYLKDERDPVLIHAKAFRRSFLKEHNIRFNPKLTWCEDSAFLAVVEMEIDHQRIGKIRAESPLYAWVVREGSMCNRGDLRTANLLSFFDRHCYVQDEFRKRGLMEPYYTMTMRVMGDSYKHLFLSDIADDTSEYLERTIEYWRKHRDDLFHLSKERYDMALDAVDRESLFEGKDGKMVQKKIPREALKGWFRELTEEVRRRGGEFEKAIT